MTIIYQPLPYVSPYAFLTQALSPVIIRAAADFVVRQNQPFEYYIGYGLASGALTTGVIDDEIVLQVIGAAGTVKVLLEGRPGATQVEVFLDGVTQGVFDTNNPDVAVLEFLVTLADALEHEIRLVNVGSLLAGSDFLTLLGFEAPDLLTLEQGEVAPMATYLVSATIRDAKTASSARLRNKMTAQTRIPVSTYTIAQVTAWAQAFATRVNNVCEGVIEDLKVAMDVALPGGLRTDPIAGSDVQEGGLISFQTSNADVKESFRVPAYLTSNFLSTGNINLAATETAALVDLLTGQVDTAGASIPACDVSGNTFSSDIAGKKSFRK